MASVSMVPVGVIAKRARTVRRFVTAGARNPETARSLDELGLTRGLVVRRMIKGGVLREGPDGRLWFDEIANVAFRRRSRWYVAIALGLGAVVVVIVLLTR